MNYLSLKLTLVIAFIATCACAEEKYHGISLDSVSRVLWMKSNEFFLVADAYKDGLIKDGGIYELSYTNNKLLINNKELPHDMAIAYIVKLQRYWDEHYVAEAWRTVHLKGKWDVYTVQYQLAICRFMPCMQQRVDTADPGDLAYLQAMLGKTYRSYLAGNAALVKSLCEDGIPMSKEDVHIRYNDAEVFINGNKQDDAHAFKYRNLVAKIDGTQPALAPEYYGYTLRKKEVENFMKYLKDDR